MKRLQVDENEEWFMTLKLMKKLEKSNVTETNQPTKHTYTYTTKHHLPRRKVFNVV